MNLSDQAVGAVMMALQRSILEQSDIVPVLKSFELRNSDDGLMVMNPPTVRAIDNDMLQEMVSEDAPE